MNNGGLILNVPELGRELAENDGLKLHTRGYCMFPLVRPGDILHVKHRSIEQVCVGDIVVCRRPEYLFAHRVIGKWEKNGRPCLYTRSDNSRGGNDAPVFAKRLVGVVSTIERGGKRFGPESQPCNPVQLLALRSIRKARQYMASILPYIMPIFHTVQQTELYHQLGRQCLKHHNSNKSFVVQLFLLAGQSHNLYRSLPADTFNPALPTWQGRPPESWNLALYLKDRDKPAAMAAFIRSDNGKKEACWRLKKLQVRMRYHGLGLQEELIQKAEKMFSLAQTEVHMIIPSS